MQASGQYGEVPQFLGRVQAHHHMFNLSHEMGSLSSSSTASHAHNAHSHIQQQQQQQNQQQQHQQQQQNQDIQSSHHHLNLLSQSSTPHNHHHFSNQAQSAGGFNPQSINKKHSEGSPNPNSLQSTPASVQSQQQQQHHVNASSSVQLHHHMPILTTNSSPQTISSPPSHKTPPPPNPNPNPNPNPSLNPNANPNANLPSNLNSGQVGPSPNNSVPVQAAAATGEESFDGDEGEEGEKGGFGGGGSRWPRQEALALLKIRSDMDAVFRDSSLKGPLWEEVSRKLADMGYHRSAKKCKEKFENVHKYYKRTKDGKAGRQDGKSYRFFSQLEALYGKASAGGEHSSNINIPKDINRNSTNGMLQQQASDHHMQYYSHGDHQKSASFETGSAAPPPPPPPVPARPLMEALPAATMGPASGGGVFSKPDSDHSTSGLNLSTDDDSSDDDEGVDAAAGDHHGTAGAAAVESRKRKRKSTPIPSKKYLLFFENVMKRVLQKQEQMQQKFLEALERRDNDRMIREEAWKRQEMARLSREHDLRAQERALSATRDAALVAFLQKITGQALQLPQTTIQAQPTSISPIHDLKEDYHHDKEFYDPNSKRWPKPEVLALIKLRTTLDRKFHEPGSKSQLWEEISATMAAQGYNRSAKRCKEKWENINKYFKKAKESNKKRPENAKTCPYYHHLDALYKEGVLGGSYTKQLLLEKGEEQSENLNDEAPNTRDSTSGQAQEGASEMLAAMPAGENQGAGAVNSSSDTTNNVESALPFFTSSDANTNAKKVATTPLETGQQAHQQASDSTHVNPPNGSSNNPMAHTLERVTSAKSLMSGTAATKPIPNEQPQQKVTQMGSMMQ